VSAQRGKKLGHADASLTEVWIASYVCVQIGKWWDIIKQLEEAA
jgi:hypothetical protein